MRSPIKAAPAGGRLSLFFVEMIIVLLFFSIASVTILRTFAASDSLSRESGRLERMSFCAQSAAELYSETGNLSETSKELFGIETENADTVIVPLDEQCRYSKSDVSLYMSMTAVKGERDGLSELHIAFSDKGGETVYEIKSGAYLPEKEDGGNE